MRLSPNSCTTGARPSDKRHSACSPQRPFPRKVSVRNDGDDTRARRAVVALMLCGIALEAFVAPATAVALAVGNAEMHVLDTSAFAANVAFNAAYFSTVVASLWLAGTLGKARTVALSF